MEPRNAGDYQMKKHVATISDPKQNVVIWGEFRFAVIVPGRIPDSAALRLNDGTIGR